MGSVRAELSLEFRPTFVPKTITEFLGEVSMIGNVSEKISKLDGFVKLLEEEMRKIDAFKRELPYCMLLLNDAILVLKEESIQCAAKNVQPVLEEFIPLKKREDGDEEGSSITTRNEKDSTIFNNKDKKNWMSSVQLWNSDDDFRSTNQKPETKKNEEDPFQLRGCEDRGGIRSFTPFKAYSVFASRKEEKKEVPVPGLTLLTPGIKNLREESGSSASRASSNKAVSSSVLDSQSSFRSGPQPPQQQTARKQRRCWSPELHRRFVNALQQLGGYQVATPKQIRELMQVDGLTNDEVKSHLQKYRLHTRRIPSTTTTTTSVLGGSLWISQEQYGESLKGNASQFGSPEGPLQLAANTGGDSMEDEDAKSEGYSWKSHVHKPGKIAV
ncbi:hypothetical protein SLE2022_202170 [Rubroshorea leprosula]